MAKNRDKTVVLFRGSRMFRSPYLAAEDLNSADHKVTITKVESIELDGDAGKEDKGIVHFREFDKALLCNKTNARRIARIHGTEASEWVGETITIYATMVEFGGDEVLAIRVRSENGEAERSEPAPSNASKKSKARK